MSSKYNRIFILKTSSFQQQHPPAVTPTRIVSHYHPLQYHLFLRIIILLLHHHHQQVHPIPITKRIIKITSTTHISLVKRTVIGLDHNLNAFPFFSDPFYNIAHRFIILFLCFFLSHSINYNVSNM